MSNNFYFCVDSPAGAVNACNFEFELPSPLQLEGTGWSVALCELSYVNKHANVLPEENVIRVSIPLDAASVGGEATAEISRTEVMSIPPGTTRNVNDLVRTIQNHIRAFDTNVYIKIAVNPQSGKVEYRLPHHWSVHIRQGSLARMLGFGDDVCFMVDRGEVPYPVDLYGGDEIFHLRCDFVESCTWINACRKSILGPSLSLELADVGIHIRRRCEQLMYVPVNRQRLQTLTFTLEGCNGQVLNIAHRTHFLLHFKKQSTLPFLRNV